MLRRTKDYFLNSSIHGLHYIVDPDGHWTERLVNLYLYVIILHNQSFMKLKVRYLIFK